MNPSLTCFSVLRDQWHPKNGPFRGKDVRNVVNKRLPININFFGTYLIAVDTMVSVTHKWSQANWHCFRSLLPPHKLRVQQRLRIWLSCEGVYIQLALCLLCSQTHTPDHAIFTFFLSVCLLSCRVLQAQLRVWRRPSDTGVLRPPQERPPIKRLEQGGGCGDTSAFLTPTALSSIDEKCKSLVCIV